MSSPLRIAIADDHALFREGLRAVLEGRKEVTVVAETDRAADVAEMLAQTPADVLLLDLQMERKTIADVEAHSARLPVVVLTASESIEEATAAIRRGARAVVHKRFAVETLMQAITAVATGRVWMPEEVQTRLTEILQGSSPVLTQRECEVVRQVARGLRNAEVARALFISEETVKTHLNNIFRKLSLRDRVELTLYAVRVGIVGSDERDSRRASD
jgi:DNA-binding NarL/FixJ family response regulator